MMSCPLSLPLPLLPPDLHADYPPVHIGIKVGHMLYFTVYKYIQFFRIIYITPKTKRQHTQPFYFSQYWS